MHMYPYLTSDMAILLWSFIVVKSDVGVLISPGKSIRLPPAVNLVLRVSVFGVGHCIHISYMLPFYPLVCLYGK